MQSCHLHTFIPHEVHGRPPDAPPHTLHVSAREYANTRLQGDHENSPSEAELS